MVIDNPALKNFKRKSVRKTKPVVRSHKWLDDMEKSLKKFVMERKKLISTSRKEINKAKKALSEFRKFAKLRKGMTFPL